MSMTGEMREAAERCRDRVYEVLGIRPTHPYGLLIAERIEAALREAYALGLEAAAGIALKEVREHESLASLAANATMESREGYAASVEAGETACAATAYAIATALSEAATAARGTKR